MVRNFDNRIEVACPIYDKSIQEELRTMLNIQIADNVKSRIIGSGLLNEYKKNNGAKVRSQLEIYKYFEERQKSGDTL